MDSHSSSLPQYQPLFNNSTVLPPFSALLNATYQNKHLQHLQQNISPSRSSSACHFPPLDRLRSSSAMDVHAPSPISPNRFDGTPAASQSTSSTPSLCSDAASAHSNKLLPTPTSFTSTDPAPVPHSLQPHALQPTFIHSSAPQQSKLFSSLQAPLLPTHHQHQKPKQKVHAPLSDRARLAYFQLANLSSLVNLTLLSPVLKPPTTTSPIPPLLINSRRHLALRTFCERIFLSTRLSPPVVILALRYVHRLVLRASTSTSTSYFPSTLPTGLKLSPRALLIVSLLLANKFLEDQRYSNATWARLGGLELDEINRAERECLAALAYDLTVSESEYADWLRELEGIVDAAKRGSDAEKVKNHHASVMASTRAWVQQQQQQILAPALTSGGKMGRERDVRAYMPY